MKVMRLVCTECGREFSLATRRWRCECGGVFELAERPRFRPEAINAESFSLWRYRAMLPALKEPISLGEGWTPLVPAHAYKREFLAKLEFLAPTGSFKDRGTTVLVSFLRELGVDAVVEDSSGNAAASLAAYCARAKIRCRIFVPAHASPAKLAQIRAYGAELILVEGPRENASLAAQQAAQRSYYASHVYSPLILEGTKTIAYEIWEQLGGRAPEAMLFPTGHGTLLLGRTMAFGICLTLDLSRGCPRSTRCNPKPAPRLRKPFTKISRGCPTFPRGRRSPRGFASVALCDGRRFSKLFVRRAAASSL
jgi:threonine synthase